MRLDINEVVENLYTLDWADKLRLFREVATYIGRGAVIEYVKQHLGKAALFAIASEHREGEHFLPGGIVCGQISGRPVLFFVNDFSDTVQICHANGVFYEPEELEIISKHFKPGDVFLDVGANIGNHSLFVAHFLSPSRVIAIEPNKKAYTILQHNVNLNSLSHIIDTTFLGVGLSHAEGRASLSVPPENLAGARLHAEATGGIVLRRGDDLFKEVRIDFIKIDTEGMEMDVLAGLQRVIGRSKPAMFIEVDDDNVSAFTRFLEAENYVIYDRYRRYSRNENFMVVHAPT
jgi:FkbM family methyltransferase